MRKLFTANMQITLYHRRSRAHAPKVTWWLLVNFSQILFDYLRMVITPVLLLSQPIDIIIQLSLAALGIVSSPVDTSYKSRVSMIANL
jgi:hypothetical protein